MERRRPLADVPYRSSLILKAGQEEVPLKWQKWWEASCHWLLSQGLPHAWQMVNVFINLTWSCSLQQCSQCSRPTRIGRDLGGQAPAAREPPLLICCFKQCRLPQLHVLCLASRGNEHYQYIGKASWWTLCVHSLFTTHCNVLVSWKKIQASLSGKENQERIRRYTLALDNSDVSKLSTNSAVFLH